MATEGVLSFEGRQRGEGREDGIAPTPPISYGLREAFMAALSASILLASPNTASRSSTSHGPCGSLNVAPKALANGVCPLAATVLKITRRGSAALYLLL